MKKITKGFRAICLLLVLCMVFSVPAFALEEGAVSTEEGADYYEIDGKKYVTVDGEIYRYLTLEDFTPVEDMELIQALNASTFSTNASSYLPVPPTFDHDLSTGPYYGTVDLTNGNQFSPIFKQNIQKWYTTIKATSPSMVTASLGIFRYNAFTMKWSGYSDTDQTLDGIKGYKISNGSAGEAVLGLRILFFKFDNSTSPFNYVIGATDV